MARDAVQRSRCGLTLLEVLMALAIMGIGIIGLVSAASRCLAIVRKSKNYENARHLLGRVEMDLHEYLLENEGEVEAGSGSVRFDSPFDDGWNGSWTLTEMGDGEDETKGLFELHLKVSWSERGQENNEEVVSYLYAPEEVIEGDTG